MIGMLTLNLAIGAMHISLAMTLRATEPIFTALLTVLFISSDKLPNTNALACLVPIVLGAGLSSMSSANFSAFGGALIVCSNVAFATRAIVYKKTKEESKLTSFEMFYYICRNASVAYVGLSAIVALLDTSTIENAMMVIRGMDIARASLLIVNGVCFFLYLQLSVVVLAQVSAVTHGVSHASHTLPTSARGAHTTNDTLLVTLEQVMNAMRRPVTIVAASVWFGTTLSTQNALGVGIACLGSLLYSVAQKAGAARA